MRWCPITLRASLSDSYTASGIYIVDPQSKVEICFTLSTTLGERIKAYDQKAIGAVEVSLDRVVWENLELVSQTSIDDVNRDLSKYKREFKVIPTEEIQLLVFKFEDSEKLLNRAKEAQQRLNIMTPEPRRPVTITSSPFATAHMALFHAYMTTGLISLVRQNLVFVDGRYLDGMEGGCVSIPNIGSIGMAAGSMIKSNGEGRMLLVVPWSKLIGYLPKNVELPVLKDIQPIRSSGETHPLGGVVAVQIKVKPNIVSWGSGVLITPNLVVTNNHVVGKHPAESIGTHIDSIVRYAKEIHRPIKSLDLVIIELSSPFPSEFHPATLAKNDASTKDRVHALGYGLFAPERYGETPVPLQSEGIVSKAVKGMLMSTASCWNGSSGGALLNTNNELVGIMASNAKDNSADEIMPDIAMSIPVSYVKQGLAKLVEKKTALQEAAETDPQFQKVWKLDRTHEDISQPARSKL